MMDTLSLRSYAHKQTNRQTHSRTNTRNIWKSGQSKHAHKIYFELTYVRNLNFFDSIFIFIELMWLIYEIPHFLKINWSENIYRSMWNRCVNVNHTLLVGWVAIFEKM